MKKLSYGLLLQLSELFQKRYIFNKDKLKYSRFIYSPIRFVLYLLMTIMLGITIYIVISINFSTPKEKILQEENKDLFFDIQIMNSRLNSLNDILNDVQMNDSLVYRTMFEIDPYYRKYNTNSIMKYDSLSKIDKKYIVEFTHRKILKLDRYL